LQFDTKSCSYCQWQRVAAAVAASTLTSMSGFADHLWTPTSVRYARQLSTNTSAVLTALALKPFDAHCCHMGTAIQHPVPDRAFVIFDIRALWRSALSVRVSRCQKLQKRGLAQDAV